MGLRHLLYVVFLSVIVFAVAGCSSCGGDDKGKKPEGKTKKQKRAARTDTCGVDSLDSLSADTLTADTLPLDTLIADTVDTIPQPLTEWEFAQQNFVELKTLIPDVIEDIRYCTEHNFVGTVISGYKEPVALTTRQCGDSLKVVADLLRQKGYRLKIYDAYRPDDAVQHFRRWAGALADQKMKEEFYPEIDKAELFKMGFISSRSKHCHGSTVDLTLCDIDGEEIDMGGAFDFFSLSSHSDFIDSLTNLQRDNRALLREAMEKHGFKIATTEWWHFSLIDEPFPDRVFNFPVKHLMPPDVKKGDNKSGSKSERKNIKGGSKKN